MATMYPRNIDLIIQKRREAGLPVADKGFEGEMAVYRELEKMPRNWHILYNCWLKDRDADVNFEADFVLLIPGKGILVLEVKTRALRIVDGHWRDAENKPLHYAPAQQAHIAAKGIAQFLGNRSIISRSYGDSAPFVEYTSLARLNGLQRPQEYFIDQASYLFDEEVPQMKEKIEAAFTRQSGFDAATLDKVKKALLESHHFQLSPLFMARMIEAKTAEISNLLPMLAASPNGIWVEGCAGSGKTVIAINEIIRLSQESSPRILYTCYNKKLETHVGQELRERLGSEHHVRVCSFFQLLREIRGENFRRNADGSLDDDDCDIIIAKIQANDAPQFDYIFVDEAQDLGIDIQSWSILSAMLKRKKGIYEHLYAFADSNQKLYNGLTHVVNDPPPFGTHVRLRSNLRNPGNIGQCGALAFDKEVQLSYLPLTGKIDLREGADSAEERADIVVSILDELYREFGEEAFENTVILSPLAEKAQGENALEEHRSLKVLTSRYLTSGPGGQVRDMCTIKSFKGLEASFVILTDIPGKADCPAWGYKADDFYVGCTRAKERLYIIPTTAGYRELQPCLDSLSVSEEE